MSNYLIQITLLSQGLRDQSSFKLFPPLLLGCSLSSSRCLSFFPVGIRCAQIVMFSWLGGDSIFSFVNSHFYVLSQLGDSPLNPQCKYGLCSYAPESPRLLIPEGEFLLRGLDRAQASGWSS